MLYSNSMRTSSSLLSALHMIKLCSWLLESLCVCLNQCYFNLSPQFLLSSELFSYSKVIFKLSLAFAGCRNTFFCNGSWDSLLWIYSVDKPLKEIGLLINWWWRFQLFAAFLTPQNQLLFRFSQESIYVYLERLLSCLLFLLPPHTAIIDYEK